MNENLSPRLLIGDPPQLFANYSIEIGQDVLLRLRHTHRVFGGHWELSFYLADSDVGTAVLDEYFGTLLMGQIAEYFGITTWVGVIWEMVRIKDGKRSVRSMADVYNAVKCVYTPTGSTVQTETSFVTDDDSIERYLRKEYVVYADNVSSSQATDEATKWLNTHYDAWPTSTDFNTSAGAGLEITAFGMGRLFNNLFCTVTTPEGLVDVDDFVDDIWDTDLSTFLTFLSLSGIDTNNLEVEREQRKPTRCGDLIDALARGGDSDVPYFWGVNLDLGFRFEEMSTTPTLEWRGRSQGGLFKVGGSAVSWDGSPGIMRDKTAQELPAIAGSFLEKRNDELIAQMSMWQGEDQPTPETEEATEGALLASAERYARMITDGNFDRLHTIGASSGYKGDR